jgi:flagellar biogenesis protein FliO
MLEAFIIALGFTIAVAWLLDKLFPPRSNYLL